jgi:broad specificity phosphatase PhoE
MRTRHVALALLLPTIAGAAAAQAGEAPCTRVLAVRHAEKEPGGADPALSDAGRARARALAEALAAERLDAILVSPTRRARETAAPLAEARSLAPVGVPLEGGAAAHVGRLAAEVEARPGATVLVVGHSNTTLALLRALGAEGPEVAGDLADDAYGDLFAAELCAGRPARVTRTRFEAPGSAAAPRP